MQYTLGSRTFDQRTVVRRTIGQADRSSRGMSIKCPFVKRTVDKKNRPVTNQ